MLLFVAASVGSVVLVSWLLQCRGRRQDGTAEALLTPTLRSQSLLQVSAEGFTSVSDPPTSSGNLSRQRFLEARRSAARRRYGGTDEANEV